MENETTRTEKFTKQIYVDVTEEEYDFLANGCNPGTGIPGTVRKLIEEEMNRFQNKRKAE